jgi:hypothetical protein
VNRGEVLESMTYMGDTNKKYLEEIYFKNTNEVDSIGWDHCWAL